MVENVDDLTINDVFPVHFDVVIPVGASLLVVEAEGMEQLVLDSAMVQTALSAQGHRLTAALTTHVGVAATMQERTAGCYAQSIKYRTTAVKQQRMQKFCRIKIRGIFNLSHIPVLTPKQPRSTKLCRSL